MLIYQAVEPVRVREDWRDIPVARDLFGTHLGHCSAAKRPVVSLDARPNTRRNAPRTANAMETGAPPKTWVTVETRCKWIEEHVGVRALGPAKCKCKGRSERAWKQTTGIRSLVDRTPPEKGTCGGVETAHG